MSDINQSPNVKHKHEDSAIDVEVVSAAGLAPVADSKGKTVARAVMIQTAGDLIVDLAYGQKNVTIPFTQGVHSINILQVKAGGTAQGVTLLY